MLYAVEADVGRLDVWVEAADEEAAINEAISEWERTAGAVFSAATFVVRPAASEGGRDE